MITSNDFSLSEFDSMRRAELARALKERSAEFFAVIPSDLPNPLVEFYAVSDLFEDIVRTVFADSPSNLVEAYLNDLRIARERRIGDWKSLEKVQSVAS